MATKGSAAKSSSGASMSRYDVEVEGRLKALEAEAHKKPTGATAAKIEERLSALEAKAHEKCDGGGKTRGGVDASTLPPLATKRDESYVRLDALEARLEALIAALS